MATLLLTRTEVAALVEQGTLLPALRAAFIAHSAGGLARAQRVRSALPGPGSATVLFPRHGAGVPAYTRSHAKFPRSGSPRSAAFSACTARSAATCWPSWTRPT